MRSKFDKLNELIQIKNPILLPKNCKVTAAIVNDLHLLMQHAQTYKLLATIRRKFYVPSAYNFVRKILRKCVFCRKLHGHAVKVNSNAYRDFRIEPGARPYTSVMCDFTGHFFIKQVDGTEVKNYVLLITCLYSGCKSVCLSNFGHRLFFVCFAIARFAIWSYGDDCRG